MRSLTIIVAAATSAVCATSAGAGLDAPRARPRVAVVVVGGNVSGAGALQQSVMDRLATVEEIELVPLAETVAKLGAGARPPKVRDPASAANAAKLFEQGKGLYFRDKGAAALDQFTELAKLQAADELTPNAERVRLRLWRMAIFLSLKDREQAEHEALAALALDPAIVLDAAEFPPSVQDAIAELRLRRLRTLTVMVSGFPAGAHASVDGRTVGERFEVGSGSHRISVSAPGFRDWSEDFEAVADRSMHYAPALMLDSALDTTLSSAAMRGTLAPNDLAALGAVAHRVDADWVFVAALPPPGAAQGGFARGLLVRPAAPAAIASSAPVVATGASSLGDWAASRLVSALPTRLALGTPLPVSTARPVTTPRGRPTPTPRARDRDESSWEVATGGGLLAAARSQSVKGTGGRALQGSFFGAGPQVDVFATRGFFTAHATAGYIDYAITTVTVKLPDNTHPTVAGGSTVFGAGSLGARFALGEDTDSSTVITLGAGAGYESHTATDARDSSSVAQGLFTSYTREAAMLSLDARVPLTPGNHPAALRLGATVEPAGAFVESPAGTTGKTPKFSLGVDWRAGVELTPSSRLSLMIAYAGGLRGASFTGIAASPLASPSSSPMTNAKFSETVHTFTIGTAYRF